MLEMHLLLRVLQVKQELQGVREARGLQVRWAYLDQLVLKENPVLRCVLSSHYL